MRAGSRKIDLEIAGKIHDPIHGFVHLTKAELAIIDSPYFQRLRNIRQLAQVNLVFPGGEHTRFAHSLGVLWIMDRICRHLQISNDYQCHRKLRMAALLHDIGHFPLSHTLETVYRDEEKKITKSQLTDLRSMVLPKQGRAIASPSKPVIVPRITKLTLEPGIDAALHERLGKHIIQHSSISHILTDYGYDPHEIGMIVIGADDYSDQVAKQLMHSELDADQMDYFLRDAASLGVGYSSFDHRFLIECLAIKRLSYTVLGQNVKRDVLCVLDKGVHALDHYYLAKYFYFSQLLFHKTRYIVEAAAGKLCQLIMETQKYSHLPTYRGLSEFALTRRFFVFDDITFYSLLRRVRQERILPKEAETLFKIVLDRRIPHVIYSSEFVADERLDEARMRGKDVAEEYARVLKGKKADRDRCLQKFKIEKFDEKFHPFGKGRGELLAEESVQSLAEQRDPVRIFDRSTGKVRWAVDGDGSLLARLKGTSMRIVRAYGKPKRRE